MSDPAGADFGVCEPLFCATLQASKRQAASVVGRRFSLPRGTAPPCMHATGNAASDGASLDSALLGKMSRSNDVMLAGQLEAK